MRRFTNAMTARGDRMFCRFMGSVVREVDMNGFQTVVAPPLNRAANAIPALKQSTLFTGCANTGKMTMLLAAREKLEHQGKVVAVMSADPRRAMQLDGMCMHSFLGLRVGAKELPIREQMEATFERHLRLMGDAYNNFLPSLRTCDALIFDSLHLAPPVVLQGIDSVCRRIRNSDAPFGGVLVVGSADFWRLPVHPSSPYSGYHYQLPEWDTLFPQQVLLDRVWTQNAALSKITHRALMGDLSDADIEHLEESGSAEGLTPVVDNLSGYSTFLPKFPRQPSKRASPNRIKNLRSGQFGAHLLGVLSDGFYCPSFGLVDRLSLQVGDPVHLALDGCGLKAGARGTLLDVTSHRMKVDFAGVGEVDVPPVRLEGYHSEVPEVRFSLIQFPLFPRATACPSNIIKYGKMWGVEIDCGCLVDTNDLGNILAQMRSTSDFVIKPDSINEMMRIDGIVHEPTRIYYAKLSNTLSEEETFCRNCKEHVPGGKAFYEHWNTCVASQRWCSETNQVIPMAKWEPHNEKLQVVMCIDCGMALEWKNWELHRLSCNPMLREITADNEFLPEVTRNTALTVGYDKRDLHSVKPITKSLLPKTRKELKSRR